MVALPEGQAGATWALVLMAVSQVKSCRPGTLHIAAKLTALNPSANARPTNAFMNVRIFGYI
jgi:hypothetical protein